MIVLLTLLSVAFGAWSTVQTYTGNSCASDSSNLIAMVGVAGPCVASACACVNNFCASTQCYSGDAPVVPANLAGFVTYSSGSCSAGSATAFAGYGTGSNCVAVSAVAPQSYKVFCSGGVLNVQTFTGGTCSGSANTNTYSFGCTTVNGLSFRSTCSSSAVTTTSVNVTVTLTFSAVVTVDQVTAIQGYLAIYLGRTVTITGAGTATLTFFVTGTNAGLYANGIVGNVQVNAAFFSSQNSTIPSVTSARAANSSIISVSFWMLIALLAISALFL